MYIDRTSAKKIFFNALTHLVRHLSHVFSHKPRGPGGHAYGVRVQKYQSSLMLHIWEEEQHASPSRNAASFTGPRADFLIYLAIQKYIS